MDAFPVFAASLDELSGGRVVLTPGDIPQSWTNTELPPYRNDIEGKHCVEELKTAITTLSEQGCGDPNFIPVNGLLELTRKQMREGLEILDVR